MRRQKDNTKHRLWKLNRARDCANALAIAMGAAEDIGANDLCDRFVIAHLETQRLMREIDAAIEA